MRKAICVAVIINDQILLVRKNQTWILPGGKPEAGESDLQCLVREVSEEVPGLKLENIKHFGAFSGITPHKGDELLAEVYFADASGEVAPAAEIKAVEWTNKPEKYNLSDITKKIVASLINKGYL